MKIWLVNDESSENSIGVYYYFRMRCYKSRGQFDEFDGNRKLYCETTIALVFWAPFPNHQIFLSENFESWLS